MVVLYDDTEITDSLLEEEGADLTLHIAGCSFINNTNLLPLDRFARLVSVIAVGFETERILLTGSSALAVYFGQRRYFVDLRVTDTAAISNYGSIGGMTVFHYNTFLTARTLLDRVTLYNNTVETTGGLGRAGGIGIVVTVFFDALSSFGPAPNEVFDIAEISRSNLSGNSAHNGGAFVFYVTPQNVTRLRLIIRDCSLVGNVASFGSAFLFFQFQSSISNRAVYVHLEDVEASDNTFPGADLVTNSPENSAVFLLTQASNMTVVGTEGKGCRFHHNHVSVFGATGTNVVLSGWISFEDNHGFTGGAISLLDNSLLFIHNGSTLTFTRNRASTRGGAIYSNTLGSILIATCAIQFMGEKRVGIDPDELTQLHVSMVFSDNFANYSGNSIYAVPLYLCFFLQVSAVDHIDFNHQETVLYNEVFEFSSRLDNKVSEISSAPWNICVCRNTTFSRDDCLERDHTLDHDVIPGDTVTLWLNSVDLDNSPVASLLYTEVADSDTVTKLDFNQDIRALLGLSTCNLVKFTIFSTERREVHLKLSAVVGGGKVTVKFNTLSCPPGFKLSTDTVGPECVCSDFIEDRDGLHSTCDTTNYIVARPDNYWIGTAPSDNGTKVVQFVSTCPINYCRRDVTYVNLTNPDDLCVHTRRGVLCGRCKDRYSAVFGPSICKECSNASLSLLLVFAVFGFLIVFFTFLLDLTITRGTINGLIFFANVLQVNANIFYFQGYRGNFLIWFISWLNLEVGFPLCFYDGMTETAKLGLNYIFPVYTVAILVVVIVLSKHSLLMQRVMSRLDGVHALVSILYLICLRLLRTVIDTSTFVSIVTQNRHREQLVWFYDGNKKSSDWDASLLLAVGTLVLAGFILPYMFYYSLSNYIQRYVTSVRMNSYTDATLAPYKLRFRSWFGARLVLTGVLYTIIALRGTDNPRLTLTLELSFLVGFSILQVYLRPFKSLGIALLDMSFFVNLIALMLGTSYNIQSQDGQREQEILVDFSLSIVFVTFVGIIVYHSAKRLYKVEKIKLKVDELSEEAAHLYARLRSSKKQVDVTSNGGGGGGVKNSDGVDGMRYLRTATGLQASPTSFHLSLNKMTPAPDDIPTRRCLPQRPSSSELREPVMDFLDVIESSN